MKVFIVTLLFSLCLLASPTLKAQTEIGYVTLEPEIVTNFAGNDSRKLGYVRLTVTLVTNDVSEVEIAEHHLPLLRATVIEVIGQQSRGKVLSITGQEDIKQSIEKALQDLMMQETGSEIIREVIFNRYLTNA